MLQCIGVITEGTDPGAGPLSRALPTDLNSKTPPVAILVWIGNKLAVWAGAQGRHHIY